MESPAAAGGGVTSAGAGDAAEFRRSSSTARRNASSGTTTDDDATGLRVVVGGSLGVLAPSVAVLLVAAVADDVRRDAEERQFLLVRGDALVPRVVRPTRPATPRPISTISRGGGVLRQNIRQRLAHPLSSLPLP